MITVDAFVVRVSFHLKQQLIVTNVLQVCTVVIDRGVAGENRFGRPSRAGPVPSSFLYSTCGERGGQHTGSAAGTVTRNLCLSQVMDTTNLQ